MSRLYGPHYEKIWREALVLPGHDDLLGSLAAEVADHLDVSPQAAASLMRSAFEDRSAALASFPGIGSAAKLAAYFSSEQGLLLSSYWHSLAADRYALHAVAGLHVAQQFAEGARVFEFGHGIGSAAILFARHGFELTLGDVSTVYRDFARSRLARRDIEARFVDLKEEWPERSAFDIVTSFDVLEHVPDPLVSIERIHGLLRPGGLLIMNVAIGLDPSNPEHLIPRRRGFLDRIRPLGFERIQSPSVLVYYRRDLGAARRKVYRAQDAATALVDDAVGRWPVVGGVLRTTRTPPL